MEIQRKLRLHMYQTDSPALRALAVAPMPVWTRYWTRPIRQSAMMANDAPPFKRFVVDPKASFKTVDVAKTAEASAPLLKATVLTLRLMRSAAQITARGPGINAARLPHHNT